MGRVEGKVAFITGAGRGQGRSHAVRLAQEGADIVALDICEDVEGVENPQASEADLQETVRLVEEADRRIVALKGDVRSSDDVNAAVEAGLSEFGKIDVVVANAGIVTYAGVSEMTEEHWLRTIDINLNGVFRTVKAVLPSMIERGEGGSIVLISSAVIYKPAPNVSDYITAKASLVGMARALAVELGPLGIRVNTIHPGSVLSPMTDNEVFKRRTQEVMNGGYEFETHDDFLKAMWNMLIPAHILEIGWLEPVDISNGVVFLASDESQYMTAEELRIDAGYGVR
jgi:SDR family mycofactocin-dependent oxidoreductase